MKRQEAARVGLPLRRSRSSREARDLYQAIVTYFELVEYFPETDEARRARERLLGLARRTEDAWMAREKLLSLV